MPGERCGLEERVTRPSPDAPGCAGVGPLLNVVMPPTRFAAPSLCGQNFVPRGAADRAGITIEIQLPETNGRAGSGGQVRQYMQTQARRHACIYVRTYVHMYVFVGGGGAILERKACRGLRALKKGRGARCMYVFVVVVVAVVVALSTWQRGGKTARHALPGQSAREQPAGVSLAVRASAHDNRGCGAGCGGRALLLEGGGVSASGRGTTRPGTCGAPALRVFSRRSPLTGEGAFIPCEAEALDAFAKGLRRERVYVCLEEHRPCA